jgi:flagellar FliL protein
MPKNPGSPLQATMATSSTQGATPRTSKTTVLLVALLAAALLALAGGAYFLLARPAGHAAAPGAPVAPAPIFVALDPMTVNLQAEGRSRFLHVGLTLKSADTESQARMAEYLPEVRSRILTLLSNRDPATLASAEDKARLAGEILAAVNQPLAAGLPAQRVTQVMFTAFVLQ